MVDKKKKENVISQQNNLNSLSQLTTVTKMNK